MAKRITVTLAQFDKFMVARLGNPVFWIKGERTQLLNEALCTWQCLTGYWTKRAILTTVAHQPYYFLPGVLTGSGRVSFNGVPLIEGDVFAWDQLDPLWEANFSGQPPQEWSPVGLDQIAIRPPDPAGSNSLVLDGISVTPVLVLDSDFIQIGEEHFNAILDYVQHTASFKEGGQEFQSTMRQYKHFIEEAAIQNEKFRASNLYRKVIGADQAEAEKPRRKMLEEGHPLGVRS